MAWNGGAARSCYRPRIHSSGGLLDLKGFPGHHRPAVSVDALKPRAVLQRLSGDPDDRWIFTRDRVWIERRDGEVVEERSEPRASFAGHDRNTPWDRLHLTYFLGYAMWNYLTVPFLLAGPGFASRELEEHVEELEKRRVLEVTYPDNVPAHTKVQKLSLRPELHGEAARLHHRRDRRSRHAHYCATIRCHSRGIILPTLRRVGWADARRTTDLQSRTSFILDYVDVAVRRRHWNIATRSKMVTTRLGKLRREDRRPRRHGTICCSMPTIPRHDVKDWDPEFISRLAVGREVIRFDSAGSVSLKGKRRTPWQRWHKLFLFCSMHWNLTEPIFSGGRLAAMLLETGSR